ncbi:MAG: class I SAM-dependent methyltransferase [Bacillota bacterium]
MDIFENAAGSYDSWYETKMGSFVDKVETELAFNLFKVKDGMRVLDVGCGTGNYSIKLAKLGCIVTGIDISDNMLGIARDKAKKEDLQIQFVQMDAYKLEFEDESFDGVFCMTAIEFLSRPEKALDEFFRVVKKGGQVLVGTITRDSAWGDMYMREEFRQNSVFKYATLRTLEDLKEIRREGFVVGGECLFIPPDAREEDISIEKENELAKTEKGGFACALWIK